MPQLLCGKLEDPKKFTSQALRRSRAVIHLEIITAENTLTQFFKLHSIKSLLQIILLDFSKFLTSHRVQVVYSNL